MTMSQPTPPLADDRLLLDAYVDGELDASAALGVERRLEADPSLKAEYERLIALRSALRAGVRQDRASDRLRERVVAMAGPGAARGPAFHRPSRVRTFEWRQMAASVAVAAIAASGGTALYLRHDGAGVEIGSIVAEHRRALLATAPLDVESTDKHTVKPWFDAKLALSPQVIDLAADGFPLAGGRVEVVGGRLVPAMIYRRRAHLISLVAVPRLGGHDDGGAASSSTQDGYAVAGWHGPDFDYFAVSDVAPDELAAFVAEWRAAAK